MRESFISSTGNLNLEAIAHFEAYRAACSPEVANRLGVHLHVLHHPSTPDSQVSINLCLFLTEHYHAKLPDSQSPDGPESSQAVKRVPTCPDHVERRM